MPTLAPKPVLILVLNLAQKQQSFNRDRMATISEEIEVTKCNSNMANESLNERPGMNAERNSMVSDDSERDEIKEIIKEVLYAPRDDPEVTKSEASPFQVDNN